MSAVDLARDLWLLLAALGLNIAVGHAGQPLLGQGAFVAVGGYGTALLADAAGWPLGLAGAAAVAVAGVLGWVLAYGTSRLQGASLALGTWALAWLVAGVLEAFPGRFGGPQGLVREAPATLVMPGLGLEWRLTPAWHVLLAGLLCGAAMVATWWLRRSGVGLDLAALRDGAAAAESVGVRPAPLRRGALAAAAALGGLAGAGTVVLLGVVAPSDVAPLLSVQLFAAVLLGGVATVWGPVVGVAVLVALPGVADRLADLLGTPPERSRGVLVAAFLVAALALRAPVAGWLRAALPRRIGGDSRGVPPPGDVATPGPVPNGGRLAAHDLRFAYGGVRVLDGVGLELRPGEVHALVGPNGSGKTTALRLLAGALPMQGGGVHLGDVDVTSRGQSARVRLGLARTFQRTVLFPRLTVLAHAEVGARAVDEVGAVRTLLATPQATRAARARRERARAALVTVGLAERAAAHPAELSAGEQRLLQVARAAATGAGVLLLDEPAAGMTAGERTALVTVVRRLAGNGTAVLLVEHDMRLVAALADRVTVLAEGRVLAAGSVAEMQADPAVRAAYLGEPPAAPA